MRARQGALRFPRVLTAKGWKASVSGLGRDGHDGVLLREGERSCGRVPSGGTLPGVDAPRREGVNWGARCDRVLVGRSGSVCERAQLEGSFVTSWTQYDRCVSQGLKHVFARGSLWADEQQLLARCAACTDDAHCGG